MVRAVNLTYEELDELKRMLRRGLGDTRSERRRTRNPGFRRKIEHRLELMAHMLTAIHQAQAEVITPG